MKHLIQLIFLVSLPHLNVGQQLINFEYSECMIECANDSSKFLEIIKEDYTTTLKLQTYAPCGGNLKGDFEISINELDLEYSINPITVAREDGKVLSIVEVAECNCMYTFEYKFLNLNIDEIDKILVNGETLEEIDSRNILKTIDLRIEFESMDMDVIDENFNETFDIVQIQPEFEGGMQGFYHYIMTNIKYPWEAAKLGIEGRVFIQFVIDENGSIPQGTVIVYKGVHETLDNEAMRLIKESPNWTPGRTSENGPTTKVKMVLPIIFKLGTKPKKKKKN